MPALLKRTLAALLLALVCLHAAPGQTAQVDMTDVIFKEVEKRLIREYFAAQRGDRDDDRNSRERYRKSKREDGKNKRSKHGKKGLPPGLAKRQQLPPGLAKRQQLPPGLAKRGLPPGLNDVLPATPAGIERAIVGNNVVLIRKATGVVLDILLDAAKKAK